MATSRIDRTDDTAATLKIIATQADTEDAATKQWQGVYVADATSPASNKLAVDASGHAQVDIAASSATVTVDGTVSVDNVTTSITPGTGAANLGKAVDDAAGATDTGVAALGVHLEDQVHLTTADGDYDNVTLDSLGSVHVNAESHHIFDSFNATTGWTVLGNDTANLATATQHAIGTAALTFDKVDGAANTIFAGIQNTVSSVDLGAISPHDIIQGICYIPDLTNVAYVFVRIGTNSSNYNEWRISDSSLTAATFEIFSLPIGDINHAGSTGSGWNPSAITYISVGVAFDNEANTLAGIIFDELSYHTNQHSAAILNAEVSSSVSSPNVRLNGYGGSTDTNTGNASGNTLRVVLADDQPTVTVDGFADVTAGPTALGALNAAESIVLAGRNGAGMFLAAGTLIGTIVPEISMDGGTTWVSTFFSDPITDAKINAITFASANTAATRTIIVSGGASHVRVRVSVHTSGTANVSLRATAAKELSQPFASQDGQAVPTSAILIAGSDGTLLQNARATNTTPGGTEYALITRPIPSGTQAVSAASLPLPAGAATSALQLPDGHNVTVDNAAGASGVYVQGGAADGAAVAGNPVLIGGIDSGNLAQTLQVSSGGRLAKVAAAGADAMANSIAFEEDAASADKALAVAAFDYNGSTWDMKRGDTVGSWVQGNVAQDVAVTAKPLLGGGSHETMADSAPANRVNADGDANRLSTTDGALFVIPTGPQTWSYHENSSSALTDTSVHTAPAAGLSLYVTDIVVSTGAATAFNIFFEEGASTVLGPYYLEAVAGRGLGIHFGTPKKITAATALTVTTSAAIAHSIDVTGFIAPG